MPDRQNISLSEEFEAQRWEHYDAFDAETRAQLPFQRHADIRTFMPDAEEDWTEGKAVFSPTFARYPVLEIVLPEGVTQSESAIPTHTVDLATNFGPEDLVTFALPTFPLAAINLEQSFIELTSDPNGHPSNIPVSASVPFSASEKPLIEGDSQFVVKRKLFEQRQIDLSKVTGVRFSITARENTNIVIMGLKLLLAKSVKPGWIRPAVDFDNWNGRLRKPSPLNGDITSGPLIETGILWKAADFPGINDPTPIDAEFGIAFNTGSQTKKNNVTLNVRQEPKIFQNQLDLIGVTQAELNGNPQPDIGTLEFLPRHVGEFDKQVMEELDDRETMEDMERIDVEDPLEQSWVLFQLNWGSGKTSVTMTNNTSIGYTFPKLPVLENNTNYLLLISVEDSAARVRIFPLLPDHSVDQEPLFDSTVIEDDGIFRRRKGRIGWAAVLNDNDAYIANIRPRTVTFAEYESTPLLSHTPVDGARLYASFSANEELWDRGFKPHPAGSTAIRVTRDKARSTSGESFRVDTTGAEAFVGLETNLIDFIDFTQAEIKFNIWFAGDPRTVETIEVTHPPTIPSPHLFPPFFPSKGFISIEQTQLGNIIARLATPQGALFDLNMPELETNQWQEVILTIPPDFILQSGRYSLQILQQTKIAATWWIDSVQIFERTVQWSARAVASDPWKSNFAPWTDFREIINQDRKGILLSPRGKELQLRARALRQNSYIAKPKLIPRYASLGRLVFPEERLTDRKAPTTVFSSIAVGPKDRKFTSEVVPGTGAIVSLEWQFGDGQFEGGIIPETTHHYAKSGTYYVTLIATDRNGLRSQATHKLTIP